MVGRSTNLDDLVDDRESFIEGATLQGLPLLNKVLFKVLDHTQLVSVMQQHMTPSYIRFNSPLGPLGSAKQFQRTARYPTERDRMHAEHAPFPFRGDNDPDAPPLAWTILWSNRYCNLYGKFINNEIRRWGYIFWDAARLERSGGRKVLERQWWERMERR